jgi:hypothetical protein
VLVAIPAAVRAITRLRETHWSKTLAVVAAGVAIVAVVSVASSSLPALSTSRFASLGDFVGSALTGEDDASPADTSSSARLSLFGAALTMFEERPVLGFGTGGFEAESHRLLGHDEAYPHNAVLQFAAEFGLVGVGLFLVIVIAAFARSAPERGGPIRILLVYFLLQAMLSGDIFEDRVVWGLLLLLLLSRPARAAEAVTERAVRISARSRLPSST